MLFRSIGLAAAFKRQVVAEGVESIDQLLLLLELGCDTMQGFCLARPMSAERMGEWLSRFHPDPLWSLSASPRPSRDHFELLLAEANHRHWIDQVIAATNAGECQNMQTALADFRQCRFGQWCQREGARRFHGLPEFADIERIHAAIHGQAEILCAARRAGLEDEIRAREQELLAMHQEMALLLRRFRLHLAEDALVETE